MGTVDVTRAFDAVHDVQTIYRLLVSALSRPGTAVSIGGHAAPLHQAADGEGVAAALALTLLDNETTFASRLARADGAAAFIRRMTFAAETDVAAAAYVFAEGHAPAPDIRRLAAGVRLGTHEGPEEGATVFLRVAAIAAEADDAGIAAAGDAAGGWLALTLSGPGIAGRTRAAVRGLDEAWLEAREMWNAEYPTGADVFLFTTEGSVMGLPRTTRIEEVQTAWRT